MTNEEAINYLIQPFPTSTEPGSEYLKQKEAYDMAVKSLKEPKITVFTENQTIRWTDKVSLKDNGDIIDFDGKVIGHINFDATDKG